MEEGKWKKSSGQPNPAELLSSSWSETFEGSQASWYSILDRGEKFLTLLIRKKVFFRKYLLFKYLNLLSDSKDVFKWNCSYIRDARCRVWG